MLVFGFIAGYGVVLWLLYNLIIFHNALYFMQSPYSAQTQQTGLAHFHALATKGDLSRSVLTYGWAVADVLGPPVALASVIGAACLLVTNRPDRRRIAIILGVLAAPVVFNVISLWTGQTVMNVPQVRPGGMWNDRYGLMALPLAAVTLGVVAGQFRRSRSCTPSPPWQPARWP